MRRDTRLRYLAATTLAALLLPTAQARTQTPAADVRSGTAVLTGPGPGNTSLTVLKVDGSGTVAAGMDPIRPGDAVKLRGEGDRWAAVADGFRLVPPLEASTFRVTSVPSAATTPRMTILVEPFTASTAFVTLGTADGAPCARLEPQPSGTPALPAPAASPALPALPGLRLAWQQVTAYADVRIGNPVAEFYAEVQACVGEATASSGLAHILAAPAAALPGFRATFTSCLAARAPLTNVQYVLLRTELTCQD